MKTNLPAALVIETKNGPRLITDPNEVEFMTLYEELSRQGKWLLFNTIKALRERPGDYEALREVIRAQTRFTGDGENGQGERVEEREGLLRLVDEWEARDKEENKPPPA